MVEEQQQLVQSPRETPFSRTDPDFLFNSLNSIEALSRQAPQRIPKLVRELANYLRYLMQPAPDGWVTLQQELDALTSYLQVDRVLVKTSRQCFFLPVAALQLDKSPSSLCGRQVLQFL
jgi:LytS/YehU family sensor histidine kinase